MAQRWHDTDHGAERGKPLRKSKFIVPVNEPEPYLVFPFWCCCDVCDPDWNPEGRWNPFWYRAQDKMQESV